MNNNIVQVAPATDALMDRYNELALRTEIDDVDAYALEWFVLARDADAAGRPALAGMCRGRGDFYGDNTPGVYVRVMDGNFCTFEKVAEA